MPNPGNPQDFNRYSYVAGNPLGFVDPTGHGAENKHLFDGSGTKGVLFRSPTYQAMALYILTSDELFFKLLPPPDDPSAPLTIEHLYYDTGDMLAGRPPSSGTDLMGVIVAAPPAAKLLVTGVHRDMVFVQAPPSLSSEDYIGSIAQNRRGKQMVA